MVLDPEEFVLGFDALWNTGDRGGILAVLDDDSIVELSPAPPPPGWGRYEAPSAVSEFVDTFLPGFHVDSRHIRAEGDEIGWQAEVGNDVFRAMGAARAAGTCRARLNGGKLRHFSFRLD